MSRKKLDIFEMNMEEKRLKSFKYWPYNAPSLCTKEKMAEAGFYFTGSKKEPDSACCFVCGKQLDGWEEMDDPWAEHRSHSLKCPFVLLNKPESQLKYSDLRNLEMERIILKLTKMADQKIQEFKDEAQETRKVLEEIG